MIWDNLSKYSDVGLLIFRAGFGSGMLIFHGWPKLIGGPEIWTEVGASIQIFGISFGYVFFGFLAALAESLGATCIALGLFYRPAISALGLTMLVATLSQMAIESGDPSHALKNFFICAGKVLIGPGKYSIDTLLYRNVS